MKVRELINKLLDEPMDNEVLIEIEKPWANRPVRHEVRKCGRGTSQTGRTYTFVEVAEYDEHYR